MFAKTRKGEGLVGRKEQFKFWDLPVVGLVCYENAWRSWGVGLVRGWVWGVLGGS